MISKTNNGNFFEDFYVGQVLTHATPRTVTSGDVSLYTALYGSRFAVQSSDAFAQAIGLPCSPVDDLLAFHIVFGKTVPDISLNAVANLGYARGKFNALVYPGDSLRATSTVIGLRENANHQSGVVYVHSVGINQRNEIVLDYVRWVMVRKKNLEAPIPEPIVPELPGSVAPEDLVIPESLDFSNYDPTLGGSLHLWEDYEVGERIDHVDGMTIEEAEHMTATRLYQNTARIHFNQFREKSGRFGQRLIYGGHIISLARALSFNGLSNAFKVIAINAGTHSNPTVAGNTIHAWSEILEKIKIPNRRDIGALRLRTVATKDSTCADFPFKEASGKYNDSVVLDFDYTVLIPRR
jgi:2-methylfumaryl-CoA hydratase